MREPKELVVLTEPLALEGQKVQVELEQQMVLEKQVRQTRRA